MASLSNVLIIDSDLAASQELTRILQTEGLARVRVTASTVTGAVECLTLTGEDVVDCLWSVGLGLYLRFDPVQLPNTLVLAIRLFLAKRIEITACQQSISICFINLRYSMTGSIGLPSPPPI
jgi:hypothetical protein